MAGGGGGNQSGQVNSQHISDWLQNFPTTSPGVSAGPNPQAQQQNPMLARLAAMGQMGARGQPSKGMGLMNQGMGMMQQGQQPMPQPQMPRQTPVMGGGPPVPQGMAPGAGALQGGAFTGGNVNPQMMNQLLMRGLLGGGGQR